MPREHAQAELRRAAVRHAVDLARLGAGVQRSIVALLQRASEEIAGKLVAGDVLTAWRRDRAVALLRQVAETVETATIAGAAELAAALRELVELEAAAVVDELDSAFGMPIVAAINTVTLSAEQLERFADPELLLVDPARRVTLATWWRQAAGEAVELVRRELATGLTLGEGVDELTRRILGRRGGPPGVLMHIPRHRVVALTRSTVAAAAAEVRLATYRELGADGLVRGIEWHAALESTRTCQVCGTRDGHAWSLTGEPIWHELPYAAIPVHVSCRCTWIARLATWGELAGPGARVPGADGPSHWDLFAERLAARGWSPEKIGQAQTAVRSATSGPWPAHETVEAWWRRDPGAAREVLGELRHRLWRSGKALRHLLNSLADEPLTIAELRARMAGAGADA